MSMIVKIKKDTFDRLQLWRCLSVIEVPYLDAIPSDYPGLMGVPKTIVEKNGDTFELFAHTKPSVDGKNVYERIIIRNKNPTCFDADGKMTLLCEQVADAECGFYIKLTPYWNGSILKEKLEKKNEEFELVWEE